MTFSCIAFLDVSERPSKALTYQCWTMFSFVVLQNPPQLWQWQWSNGNSCSAVCCSSFSFLDSVKDTGLRLQSDEGALKNMQAHTGDNTLQQGSDWFEVIWPLRCRDLDISHSLLFSHPIPLSPAYSGRESGCMFKEWKAMLLFEY